MIMASLTARNGKREIRGKKIHKEEIRKEKMTCQKGKQTNRIMDHQPDKKDQRGYANLSA